MKILDYAFSEAAYYRKNLSQFQSKEHDDGIYCTLPDLPMLNIESVYKSYGDFIADPYQKFPKSQNVIIKRAYEFGGKMIKVIWDQDDYLEMQKSLSDLHRKYYDIEPHDQYCGFYTALYRANKIIDVDTTQLMDNGNSMVFNVFRLYDDKLEKICREMREYNPKWLLLQPSIAWLLAEFIETKSIALPKDLKYIELYGEMVDESIRKKVEEAFGVTTAYTYVTNMVGAAAIECPCRNMHVISDNAVVEVLKDGVPVFGEEGDICVTGLKNHAMPIIRYLTGEKGVLLNVDCACGNKAPIIKITKGKKFPFIHLKDGNKLSAYSILGAIEFANEFMANAIKTMEVVQTDLDRFEACIELKPAYSGWKKAVVDAFLSNLREDELRQSKWKIIFSDNTVIEKV